MHNGLLADRLWPAHATGRPARIAVLAVIGSLLVAVAAQVSVPMIPVPMTLQTLAVLMVGAAYGARLGAATLALYALEGALGLPVFAEFKWRRACWPTGGYILGFILPQAWSATWPNAAGTRSPLQPARGLPCRRSHPLCAGPALAFAVHRRNEGYPVGLFPFLPGDVVKAALVALALPAA